MRPRLNSYYGRTAPILDQREIDSWFVTLRLAIEVTLSETMRIRQDKKNSGQSDRESEMLLL
jgi:3-phenylpropionate/cinnamic acid dioxygenase small subunit